MMASLLTPVPLLPVSHGFSHIRSPATCTGPSWAVKNRRPRSSGPQSPPDDASIQELPRTTLAPLPSWVDDLHARISQLAVLIHDAQDLARSPSGWIKTSALIAYNGPSIPGNFDTHSGEIVNTSTFLLKVHGLSQPLTDEYNKGLVSKDNLRGPKRFILGLYAPGKRTNSTQLVIRLTPIPAADPNAGAAGASFLRTSRPLTLDEAEPFGVYFQSSMLRVLTREGIRPKKKSQPGRSSLLKVQPTDNPGPVGSSQLCGRSDACFLIDMHASIKAGTEWIMYTNDGCYGTDHIPITPQFLLVAFRFTPRGSKEGQLTLLSPPPPIPTLPPLFFHILPLSALHSRTPGLTYAFGLTYTLPLPPSFLQKMMMNCWMQHRTSTCLSPPQLAALSRIWNKLLMTCTLPPLNRYLLIPFFISPFPVCPSHTHGLSSPLTSKTSSLSWIDTSLRT